MSLFSMHLERKQDSRAPETAFDGAISSNRNRTAGLDSERSASGAAFGWGRAQWITAGAVLAAAGLVAGCGNGLRPVVTPINPSGPASQPQSYAVVISAPAGSNGVAAPGVATIVDYSGDTIVAQSPIGPAPTTFSIDETGSNGYTVNSDGTLTNFPINNQLQQKNVTFTTLPVTAKPQSLFSPAAGLWSADLTGNVVDVLTGSPAKFVLSIPVAPTPIMVVGPGLSGQRNYAISQGAVTSGVQCNQSPTAGPLGEADGIEVASNTVSSRIPLGKCPVYAVQSADGQRLFVLNRGDDTISVINSINNTPDSCTPFKSQTGQLVTCHPVLPLSTSAISSTVPAPINGTAGMGTVAGPVYAEYIAATAQLVVANYDGSSISVIDVSLDQYGNDSPTFGTTYTIPVGTNPSSVTALYDGSRAYTANQTDGTVSVVNLSSHALVKTLPVNGNPRTVVSTQNSLFGKVYVVSPNSEYLTIIRTDQDIVDTTVLMQGNLVDVRTTTQNGASGNANTISRNPGYGQPCNLPPGQEPSGYTLQQCQAMPAVQP